MYGQASSLSHLGTAAKQGYLSVPSCFIMLLVDAVLYFFLAIYLDNVIPGEFGRTKSPIFCFLKSYWVDQNSSRKFESLSMDDFDEEASNNSSYEPIPDSLRDHVSLRLLHIIDTG